MQVDQHIADFSVVHNPAPATQATITQAAPAADTQPPTPQAKPTMIIQRITASIAANGTAQTPLHVYLRDGATGAGTIVWSAVLAAAINGASIVTATDLNIPIKSGNATLEFEGVGVSASVQSVAMSGYNRSYGG